MLSAHVIPTDDHWVPPRVHPYIPGQRCRRGTSCPPDDRGSPQPSLEQPSNILSGRNANKSTVTSSNGNIFRVTGHLCGEFTGHRWIPRTKAGDAELWSFLWSAWMNGWVNNGEAGDLRRHRAHYDVIVMLAHGQDIISIIVRRGKLIIHVLASTIGYLVEPRLGQGSLITPRSSCDVITYPWFNFRVA